MSGANISCVSSNFSHSILLLNFLFLIPKEGERRNLYFIKAFENRTWRSLFDDLYIRTVLSDVPHIHPSFPALCSFYYTIIQEPKRTISSWNSFFILCYVTGSLRSSGNLHSTLRPHEIGQERNHSGPLASFFTCCLLKGMLASF